MDFLPKQRAFLNERAKYTGFIGGIGSGKTYAGCVKALLEISKGRDGIIVAPTFPMLRDVTQKTLFEILNDHGVDYYFNKSESRLELMDASVLMRSADVPDRLRGPNLSWAYLDEAALMRGRIWEIILGRLRVGNPKAWVTTTPAGFNWVHHYFVEREDMQYKMIQASTRENTYLPPEYVQDLEDTYVGEFAKQELDAEFVAFEGLVYSDFSRERHIIEPFEIPEHWRRVRGIDYGYTNPFVCLWGALDEDGRLYIYDERYRAKTLIADHAAAIKRREGRFEFTVADHDAQDNAEMRAQGVPTVNAKKDVVLGIQRVKSMLATQGDGKPRLFVSSTCTNTIREFGYYRWSESKAGRNDKEEPVKEYDHAMDTLRYIVMQLTEKGPSIRWI